MTKETKVVWWTSLDGITDEAFTAACAHFRAEPGRQFIPKPNDILAYLADRSERAETLLLTTGDYDEAKAFVLKEQADRPTTLTKWHPVWEDRIEYARKRWATDEH